MKSYSFSTQCSGLSADFSSRIEIKKATSSFCLGMVLLLAACGGGSGDAPAPVELGAALSAGDHVTLAQSAIVISEADRAGTVTVFRTGEANGEVTVRYRFVGQSATAGADFNAQDGQLTWSAGDVNPRNVPFLVASDIDSENAETFRFELFDINGMETLGETAALSVTINDAVCSGNVASSIAGDVNLNAPCYRMQSDVDVSGNALVSVNAGTTIIADVGTSMTFRNESTIQSVGRSSLPVTFASATANQGSWRGIRLLSTSALHRIEHTSISDAEVAVDVVEGGLLASFENNVVTNTSEAALSLSMAAAEQLGEGNHYALDNGGIQLLPRRITQGQSITLPGQPAHYLLAGIISIAGDFTLEPGVELRMGLGAFMLISGQGSVNAEGTEQLPITIRGEEAMPGFWDGIQFVSSPNLRNRFSYTTISHGGGDPARAGNIVLDGAGSVLSLSNSALTHSAGYGLVQSSMNNQVTLENTVFTDNLSGDQL